MGSGNGFNEFGGWVHGFLENFEGVAKFLREHVNGDSISANDGILLL